MNPFNSLQNFIDLLNEVIIKDFIIYMYLYHYYFSQYQLMLLIFDNLFVTIRYSQLFVIYIK